MTPTANASSQENPSFDSYTSAGRAPRPPRPRTAKPPTHDDTPPIPRARTNDYRVAADHVAPAQAKPAKEFVSETPSPAIKGRQRNFDGGSNTHAPERKKSFRLPRLQFGRSSEPAAWNPVTTYYLILVPALLLGVFGLLMGFSATSVTNIAQGVNPYVPFRRTLLIALVALAVAIGSAMIPPRIWDRLAVATFGVALILQLLLIPFGVGEGGNVNWLPIPGTGGQMIQPSEFLKLATALVLARVLSNTFQKRDSWKHILLAAGIPSALAIGSVMYGADMGTALIFVALILGALWVADVPAKWFGIVGLIAGAASVFLIAISPSRTRRVIEFLPGFGSEPSTSAPTQTDHGLWALGSGGLTGLGPGASRAKWDYLQEAHTDFILAIIGEEFGLLGTLTLLIVFGALAFGVLQLAGHARSRFVRIASGGIAAWLIGQALINVGTVTGLAPVIGVPFPLVSYGGSSFLFTAMAVGVLLSFARSEAGMTRASKLNADTGGRDPRKPRRRKAKVVGDVPGSNSPYQNRRPVREKQRATDTRTANKKVNNRGWRPSPGNPSKKKKSHRDSSQGKPQEAS